jgi:hypothetical protein
MKPVREGQNMAECVEEVTLRTVRLPGELAKSGTYRELNSGRIIVLDKDELLPSSLDGRVACYIRIPPVWGRLATTGLSINSSK